MNYCNNKADETYCHTLEFIHKAGHEKSDRTGTGTRSLFGLQMRFNLKEGFPMLTTKEVHWNSVVTELLWFLRGMQDTKFLEDHKTRIWRAWQTEEGEIGGMYGKQWRHWTVSDDNEDNGHNFKLGYDQIAHLIDRIKSNPDSRRHLVSAWNVSYLPDETMSPQENVKAGRMALAPCHFAFQCYVANGELSMQVYQRSADFFLGVPFNIASYSLLTHMIAQVCGLKVGELIWSGGDCHIYDNHVNQVDLQLARFNSGKTHKAPTLELDPNVQNIDEFTHDSIKLVNYTYEPAIKAPIAI